MATSTPKIILGTMTFGLETTPTESSLVRSRGPAEVKPFLDTFLAAGHHEVDTARVYCGGDTEIVLGQLHDPRIKYATKVWPTAPGHHDSKLLTETFKKSLAALGVDKVDVFYLHAPDFSTPLEVTCKAVNDLHKAGHFERFGLSNFSAWQVAFIHQTCLRLNYVLPTVYQGMLNPICRDVNKELFPCLRALNIVFYAFNPIAGGFLSGRHKFDQEVTDGSRFDTTSVNGRQYRDRYWNKLYFEAVEKSKAAAEADGLTLLEATFRWMSHHSGLNAQDGIIIGVSSVDQLNQNLELLKKGPLSDNMVQAFDEAWEIVRVTVPSYFKDEAFMKKTATVFTSK